MNLEHAQPNTAPKDRESFYVPEDHTHVEVHVACDQPVILSKMYGPLIFMDLRIHADFDSGDWIVERSTDDGWVQWARVPGQLAEDFADDRG